MTDEHGPDAPSADFIPYPEQRIVQDARKYLPTLADLIDRLSIVQLKEIYIGKEYLTERAMIQHDIDLLLKQHGVVQNPSNFVRAVMLVMLSNRVIWENESKARQGGSEQDKLLKFTHSINGVRNRAKNVIAGCFGERVDRKTDCLAADLPIEYGNWNIL